MTSKSDLIKALEDAGYEHLKVLPTGEVAGLYQMMFTIGLFVGLNNYNYRIRYCFGSYREARESLDSWDGKNDPPGNWIKVKGRSLSGEVKDDYGPGSKHKNK